MILVDTSVSVEALRATPDVRFDENEATQFVTCGPIIQEVLQGIHDPVALLGFGGSLLSLPCLSDPLNLNLFVTAAEIYHTGRTKGYTIRSATDCLIAAIAIENDVAVWHRDRDFRTIAKYTSLRTIEALPRTVS